MMAWKWILRGLLVGLFSCVATWGVLVFGVDPNSFKPQIIAAVRDATGREFAIDGELNLDVFPDLAVTLGRLELGNVEGFDGPFLTLEGAHLKVRLLPLLVSRLDVVAMDVEGLSLFLSRDAKGRGNWMDLAAPPASGAAPTSAPRLDKDRRVPALASLIVEGLKVTDTRVVWKDELKKQAFEVRGIGIDVSDFAFGEPFVVKSRALAEFGKTSAELDFSTRAVLELTRLDLHDLVVSARMSGPDIPDSPENVSLAVTSFSTDGRLDNGRMLGLGLEARFSVRQTDNATLAGNVDLAPFSPRDVFRRLGLSLGELVDPDSFGRVALGYAWTARGERLDVSDLTLAVDNATLQGRLSVQGKTNTALTFDLRADALDLDRYIGRFRSEDASNIPAGPRPSGLPFKALRELNLQGTLETGFLKVAGLRFSDMQARVHAKEGLLQVVNLKGRAYDGRITASGAMDVRGQTPVYSWSHDFSDLQMGPLMRDVHGQEVISGTAQGTASLQTNGSDSMSLKRNLGGKFDFRVVNGALGGVNIAQQLRDGIRKLKGQSPGPAEPARTDFSVLSGSGTINRGLESTNDLQLLAPRFRIEGGGQADLAREDMDFRLTIFLEGSQGTFEEATLGLSSIPVRVSGPIREPTIIPDMEAVVKGLGVLGGQAVQETIKGVGSGLNKGVEGLKRLFQ